MYRHKSVGIMDRNHYYLYLTHKEGIHPNDNANDFTIELPFELQLKGNWYCGLTEVEFKTKEANKRIYLCTDICQDSVVKKRQMPVLPSISLKKKQVNEIYNPARYVQISRDSLRKLRIYLRDEDLKPTSFEGATLMCTLHLVKQW